MTTPRRMFLASVRRLYLLPSRFRGVPPRVLHESPECIVLWFTRWRDFGLRPVRWDRRPSRPDMEGGWSVFVRAYPFILGVFVVWDPRSQEERYREALVRYARGETSREEVRRLDPQRRTIQKAARLAADAWARGKRA